MVGNGIEKGLGKGVEWLRNFLADVPLIEV